MKYHKLIYLEIYKMEITWNWLFNAEMIIFRVQIIQSYWEKFLALNHYGLWDSLMFENNHLNSSLNADCISYAVWA